MYNKRGQGLSVNAIVLIVLGVVVLVLLILGFTLGWSKVLPFISTNNVDTLATSCSIACSTESQFDFCSAKRNLNADDVTLNDVTCNYLAKNQTQYGISKCSPLLCDNFVIVEVAEESILDNECTKPENAGKTVQALIGGKLVSKTC